MKPAINPEKVCIKAGMMYYHVNEAKKTVTVRDIRPVAEYLDHELKQGVKGFKLYGWIWKEAEVRDG